MIVKIIILLSTISPLLPILVGIRKRTSLLWLYALTGFAFDIFTTVPFYINKDVNLDIFFNVYFILEFAFISFYYKSYIFKSQGWFYSLFAFSSAVYLIILFRGSVFTLCTYGETFFSFIYMLFAVMGFYTILKEQKIIYLGRSDFFWLNVAILIYSAGTFLFFLSDHYLLTNKPKFETVTWAIHDILNIIFSILIAISLSLKKN